MEKNWKKMKIELLPTGRIPKAGRSTEGGDGAGGNFLKRKTS